MNKIILVLGSVTSKQYEPMRLDLLRLGHTPKIVRMTASEFFASIEELQYVAADSLGIDMREIVMNPDSPSSEQQYQQVEARAQELLHDHLKELPSFDVVIMDDEARELWDGDDYVRMILRLNRRKKTFTRWVVHSDGTLEVIDGYTR